MPPGVGATSVLDYTMESLTGFVFKMSGGAATSHWSFLVHITTEVHVNNNVISKM